jgi:hypothetical protein
MTKISYAIEEISPKVAQEYLEANKLNRKVTPVTVTAYARDMEQEKWRFTGAPISFDVDGNLLDGQHRLLAIIRSGTTQKFLVVRGLDTESRQAMDIGRKRSVADNLVMDHGFRNSSQVASAVRVILKWRLGKLRAGTSYRVTDAEVMDFAVENELALQEAAVYAQKLRRSMPVSLAVATSGYFETHRLDQEKAAIFWTQVVTGAGLEIGDPALSYRNAIARIGSSKHEDRLLINLELTARAWRHFVAGKKTGSSMLAKKLVNIQERDFALDPSGRYADPDEVEA